MALITPTTTYDGFENVDIVVEAAFEDMNLKKTDLRGPRPHHQAVVHPRVEHVDARHRRVREGQRPAAEGDRPSLLQPGERDEAARDRARPRDQTRKRSPRRWRWRSGSARSASWSATASRSSPTACSRTTCARRCCCSKRAPPCRRSTSALTEFGMPVGPFGMQDIAGIDVGWRIRQFLKSIGKTRAEGPQSAVPDRLYEMGRYGQKTGAGWYKYEGQPRSHSRSAGRSDCRRRSRQARHHAPRRSTTRRSSRAS